MTIPLGSGEGPSDARILVVGEAWGEHEERLRAPFQGASGQELNRMLHDAGILRSAVYCTNVVNARPYNNDIGKWVTFKRKDITPTMQPYREGWVEPIFIEGVTRLMQEIELIQPNVIIGLGNTPLWALTANRGVMKWRGSQLLASVGSRRIKFIPTLHPAYVLRDFEWRPAVVKDLQRAAREQHTQEYSNVPAWAFRIPDTVEECLSCLGDLLVRLERELLWIDFDIETAAGHIECVGLSWSLLDAIVIPFMSRESPSGYWSEESEAKIVYALYRVLTHQNVRVRWQNGLYDAQYTWRWWHFVPRGAQDTMISQHTAFCGLPKALDYQASLYCDHYVYWKDDGKVADLKIPERQRWIYNGTDCVRTREVGEVEQQIIRDLGLEGPHEFQQKFFWPVLQCMQRGVRVDKAIRAQFADELIHEMSLREAFFASVLGHPLNPSSKPQMHKLFYEDLGQRIVWKRGKPGEPPRPTLDEAALKELAKREPILSPLVRAILEYRSLGVFLSTFVNAPLDVDGRMRTSYNICGTETFRFSSSENAFGSGTNLQNVPMGGEDDESDLVLPNVRKLFIPDPGYEMFDMDLSKADLRIVTWEADEPEMKAWLAAGKDPYIEIAREYYHDPSIRKARADGSPDPKYKTFKSFAHGTHYLGTPYGLAQRIALSVREAERAQNWYFGRFPRIREWQKRFCEELRQRRFVQNIFGYRRYYFDRIDDATCRAAIAWVPQSTVALYINRIWMNLYEKYPHIWVLLQVHDSLVGQYPMHRRDECHEQLREASKIVLPYADPLVIPTGFKTSSRSWGDCE